MLNVPFETVIFLDAVGTLFDVRDSVGDIYASFAQRQGVRVNSSEINEAFKQTFPAMESPQFDSNLSQKVLLDLEKDWWRQVVRKTFQRVGCLQSFADFEQFFTQVFEYFGTAKAWVVYPEVKFALESWLSQGCQLGIISNFDSRLEQVLTELELKTYFSSITISTHVGAAKPALSIFQRALANYEISPYQALHIGDQYVDDFQGAQLAGINGIWLVRDLWSDNLLTEYQVSEAQVIHRLDELSWNGLRF